MNQTKDRRYKIPYTLRVKVIRYFKNHKNNSSTAIARHYEINVKTVNRILDKYLNKKKPNE